MDRGALRLFDVARDLQVRFHSLERLVLERAYDPDLLDWFAERSPRLRGIEILSPTCLGSRPPRPPKPETLALVDRLCIEFRLDSAEQIAVAMASVKLPCSGRPALRPRVLQVRNAFSWWVSFTGPDRENVHARTAWRALVGLDGIEELYLVNSDTTILSCGLPEGLRKLRLCWCFLNAGPNRALGGVKAVLGPTVEVSFLGPYLPFEPQDVDGTFWEPGMAAVELAFWRARSVDGALEAVSDDIEMELPRALGEKLDVLCSLAYREIW